jgi:hypothetical protein
MGPLMAIQLEKMMINHWTAMFSDKATKSLPKFSQFYGK